MICRCDNSGLGTLSWEFARNMKPSKILIVINDANISFPERYKDFETRTVTNFLSPMDLEWLLKDVDILWTAETFYDWNIVREARKYKVKTVLYTMYEMSPEQFPYTPDMLLCPSKLDYETFKERSTRVRYLPVPVATDRLLWKKRTKAKVFIHSASHGGVKGRKGTQFFLDAIPKVKNKDIKFKVFAWKNEYRVPDDPRVELVVANFKNYWQLWREGDVLVYPQDYNGICLPVIEAMSCGLGVITTDIYPFNEYMPKELLFGHDGLYKTRAAPRLIETEAAKINVDKIAEKIDEWANKDISKFSEYGKTWSKKHNWNALLTKYVNIMEECVQS